jgi:Fe-S-cluster-containing dehydrogenase component/anaerobic selenocysteine-containing dehydrogenase
MSSLKHDGSNSKFSGRRHVGPELAALTDAPSAAKQLEMDRRRWLQLMGASLALAAAGGCRWKEQEILPFAERPEGRTPGKFERFATAMPLGDTIVGFEVACVDGRPIKIEGNSRHPQSLGATDVFAQAALLELYDPDRSQSVVLGTREQSQEKTWEHFEQACQTIFQRLHKNGGNGFCVLAEAQSSPTLAALRSRLLKAFPQAKWFEYEPVSDDNERAGAVLALGRPLRMHLMLDRAKVIVCLDADPLGSHPAAVRYAHDFVAGRQPESGRMNRLYVVESGVSLTGAAADHRLPLRASQIPAFAAALHRGLIEKKPLASKTMQPFLRAIVGDLLAQEHQGRSVVCAGPAQPPEVHAVVHRINALLENVGKEKTIVYTRSPDPERPSHVDAMHALVAEMNVRRVNTLLILGGNPVYNAPADLAFGEALKRVETTVHLSAYRDETSRQSTWHLPRAHFLETWGDGRSYDGTYSVTQPMIAPLRNGRSPIEVLSMVLSSIGKSKTPSPEELVRKTFQEQIANKSSASWQHVLRDGLLAESRWPEEESSGFRGQESESPNPQITTSPNQLEIVFCRDGKVHDGRFANNSWLQELPDPVTKLTWGNAALIAPATAKELGIEHGTLVDLKIGVRQVRIPAYVLPGQAPGTIGVTLGYGRRAAGKVGGDLPDVATVGVDVYPLRTTSSMYLAGNATIEPTGEYYPLATTHDHRTIDAVGREETKTRAATLIRQATLGHYQKHPDFAKHDAGHPPLQSLWREPAYEGHRWGMTIDLSKCIGCAACVVACQAENNIPVVGKAQVLKGREMHWLRVDRYFQGNSESPYLAFQPLPCQQCELAPCEQVCPVAATVHSREGLNDMVYNRCVGTRYCANNCPFKVRRFNFFNFHKDLEVPANEIAKMKYNPQVTVRSRGVMEKCTYCVQRIQEVKIAAKNTGEAICDGQIKTACQQVCPTGAITFGDLSNPKSEVLRLQRSPRAYALLAELNIRPRTVYLAQINNPNPELNVGVAVKPPPQQVSDNNHERPIA